MGVVSPTQRGLKLAGYSLIVKRRPGIRTEGPRRADGKPPKSIRKTQVWSGAGYGLGW